MKSYVSTHLGSRERLKELVSIWSNRETDLRSHVARLLKMTHRIESKIESTYRRPLKDAHVLEVGAGQSLIQLLYFATRARSVLGIDTDIVPFSLIDYARMWRHNGTLRAAKTVGRKLLAVDMRTRNELKRQLGVQELPLVSVLQMDASTLVFPDNTFDVVYSRAVFEHLPNPRAALREIRRVLKPGGAAVVFFHLYASVTGCHDARIFVNEQSLPYWAHLRPAYRHMVRENTYLNHLSLADWRCLFESEVPGSIVCPWNDSSDGARAALSSLKAAGELSSYPDEELLSITTEVAWRKPD